MRHARKVIVEKLAEEISRRYVAEKHLASNCASKDSIAAKARPEKLLKLWGPH